MVTVHWMSWGDMNGPTNTCLLVQGFLQVQLPEQWKGFGGTGVGLYIYVYRWRC